MCFLKEQYTCTYNNPGVINCWYIRIKKYQPGISQTFSLTFRRIAALQEREKDNRHSKGQNPGKPVKAEYKHLGKPEREIQERLDKLKEGRKPNGIFIYMNKVCAIR